MFKNSNIVIKLLSIFVPMAVLAIVLTFLAGFGQIQVLNEAKEVYDEEIGEVTAMLITADRDFYQAKTAADALFYNRNNPEMADTLKSAQEDYDENIGQVRDGASELQKKIGKNEYLYKEYRADGQEQSMEEFLNAFVAGIDGYDEVALTAKDGAGYDNIFSKFNEARDYLNHMEDAMDGYTTYQEKKLKSDTIRTVVIITIVMIVIVLFGAVNAIITMLFIRKGVKQVEDDIQHLSDKDLAHESFVINSQDEFGKLTRSSDTLQKSLHEIVSTISASSDNVAEVGRTIAEMASTSDEQMENISQAINDMATTATQQADDLTSLAMNMTHMKELMDQNEKASESLAQASRQIDTVTTEGLEVIEHLTDVTKDSVRAFEEVFVLMQNISKSAASIGEASSLITDIASQTNLLSLNASIEAARAGDAGRGFAVVAEEIRQLAEQSASSAETIQHMLDELLHVTSQADKQEELVQNSVDAQNESVVTTKDKFDDIVKAIRSINDEIKNITRVNHEVTDDFASINDLVSSLSAASEENAASSQEIAATTDSVREGISDVNTSSQEVNDAAASLVEIVGQFRL